jgi:hypothetical protein
VKGFFSTAGRFEIFERFSHLSIYTLQTEYLFAMKCLAQSFYAREILSRYYALERYPARTLYVPEELLGAT